MNDQVTPEGGALPSDANASQVEQQTDVETAKPGSEAESSPAATESDKPKEPSGLELRNKELTRRLRETERRYERVLRIAEERGQPAPQPQQQQPAAAKPKTIEDFNYDQAAFLRHNTTETIAAATQAARAELARERQQETAAARRAVFDTRADAFAETVEDYEEVISGKWACSEPMAEAIEESDDGPALAYYLAQNPDEASKLAKLSAVQAGRAIAKIEDRIVSERKKAAAKPVSQAPPPAPSIEAKGDAGTRVSTTSPDSDKLSDEEWVKAEQARLNRKAKRQSG